MIPVRTRTNSDVAVFGLARSGCSAVRGLNAGGARVFAWDDNAAARDSAEREGARIAPFSEWPWASLKSLVLSPGVPLTHPAPHPVVKAARAAGVEVIGDLELFGREIRRDPTVPGRAPVIAVTGTNGKSTTTALIGHILASCGFAPEVGGNIGKPALDLAAPNGRTMYVLEVSSYQIDLSPDLVPDVSVLTNISPDHLDRHGTLENYVAVKSKLLEQTAHDGCVCIGVDDPQSASVYTRLAASGGATPVPVSVGKVLGRGIFAIDGALYDAQASRAAKIMDLSAAARLPGAHNWQNAALAYAATRPYVKDTRQIANAIASFPGLAHRIEDVGRVGNVRFVNDSKATNADAAAKALACYQDIFWILGGKPKDGGIESLAPYFPRIRKAFLIGEAAALFEQTLGDRVPHETSMTLERAVASALSEARASSCTQPIVLLSPACSSFDQFRDFEARGDTFRSLVQEIAGLPVREAS
ncbi:MAG: UDP-N-acetylmuramoyl-L-alanine--D-glutamate ligase [Rhizomicrobium sp.]|jgi:UDP-N-acetylmuramoylalanine--D-glutamate ligase